MAEIETLGLLEEIQSLVSVQLQVVSYKWLSRNYLLSSNTAKRLLQEFVEKYGNGLEIIYSLSGWLKSTSTTYHVRLVPGSKLAEAKQEFKGHCSVQVYSVQTCIPEDPAVLWNAEFLQAEELFKQPPSVENCLRDNRFCGVSNSFVKRNVDGKTAVHSDEQKTGGLGQAKSNITPPQPHQSKQKQSVPRVVQSSASVVKDVKKENNGTGSTGLQDHASKPSTNTEKVPVSEKKLQNDKSSGTGGSLANLWGRASTKSKPGSVPTENSNTVPNPSMDAQALPPHAEELGSSDDEGQNANFKRSFNSESGRKRRVVFDFSDEDENEEAVNLASPDTTKGHEYKDDQECGKAFTESACKEASERLREVSSIITNKDTTKSSEENNRSSNAETLVVKKDKTTNAPPCSPKRRKVLKTRIDERGREVTEVILEGEKKEAKEADDPTAKEADDPAAKKADDLMSKKAVNTTTSNTINRLPAAKKSPTMSSTTANQTGKAGNKKGGNTKDPKQGNILSFFKRA